MTQDEPQDAIGRRTVIGALAAAGVSGTVLSGATQSASAQTSSEPRIQLGDNFVIDDRDSGSTLVIEHQPSGASFQYDNAAGAWIPTAPIGTANDRQHIYGDAINGNSVETGSLSVDIQSGPEISSNRSFDNVYTNNTGNLLRVVVRLQKPSGVSGRIDSVIERDGQIAAGARTIETSDRLYDVVVTDIPSGQDYEVRSFGSETISDSDWYEHEWAP